VADAAATADLLAYINVFWTLAKIALVLIPVALSLRSIQLGTPAKGH